MGEIFLFNSKSSHFFSCELYDFSFFLFWLRWVFILCGLSLVLQREGTSLHRSGFCGAQALGAPASGVVALGRWSMQASVAVLHALSCSVACGIFLDRDRTHVPCIAR